MSHSTGGLAQHVPDAVAREDRREVEAEAVHVHLLDPVAEAVHDHASDDRVIGVERVAAAAVVGVPRAAVLEDVVREVVQPAEAERRPVEAALGRVVEDDVEDDLEARPVQRLHHVTELVHGAERILSRAVRLVGREERHRRVAPVVDDARRARPARSNWKIGSSSTAVTPRSWR